MVKLGGGTLLISDPFLKDPQFIRSVVLLCENNEEGSIGFIINKLSNQTLDKLLPEFADFSLPVYYGGPVQTNTLHFIHTAPNLISNGQEIYKNIYWGGNFEQLVSAIKNNQLDANYIKFFLGYSGWGKNQLQGELDEKTWLTAMTTKDLIFNTVPELIWKQAIALLGKEYQEIINYPIDPQLN